MIKALIATLIIFCSATSIVCAQSYPNKPVRIIVAYAPGGSVDWIGRKIAEKLTNKLGQSFIVENRSGAGGNVGASYVAKAEPDGYTLLMSAAITLVITPDIFKNLTYNPSRDLTPIALVAAQPNVLVTNPSIPVRSVSELIALAKSKPGKLNFGIVAVGGTNHMSGELFMSMTDTKLTPIPYRGGANAITDLLGGQIDMMFAAIPEVIQFIHDKKLRALATTTKNRTALLPEIPTLNETGLSGYEYVSWIGLVAPTGTPSETISHLNAIINDALKDPKFKAELQQLGLEPLGGSVTEFKTFIGNEAEKYQRLIKASGVELS